MRNKRGISGVILTILMIVLVLVSVIIVWGVIKNLLYKNTEQINFQSGNLFLNLKLQKVQVDSSTGNILVTVQRETGKGDLTGTIFVISDGSNSVIVKKTTSVQELGSMRFTITPSDLGGVVFAKEIQIAPVIKTLSGNKVGNAVDDMKLSNKQILESLGAVSWWKFNGNAQDSIGNNDGTLQRGVSFVNGKFGKAASFDGSSGYVSVPSPSNLPLGSIITISAWINPSFPQNDLTYNGIVSYGPRGCTGTSILLSLQNNSYPSMATWCNDFVPSSGLVVNWDQWNFIAVVLNGQSATLYVNGQSINGTLVSLPNIIQSGILNIGSTDNPGRYFKGTIDEPMIFNKALTGNQVKALYELNLD